MLGVPELLTEVVMAIALGGLIGLEREHTPGKKYAGIRTMSLLTAAAPGAVAISEQTLNPVFVAIYLVLAASISLSIVFVRIYQQGEDIGFTTSSAVFVTALLGVMIGYDLYSEAVALGILVALILAEKNTLHTYVDKLRGEEITSALQLAALAFVLLPVLPSTPVGPMNSIVPRDILLLVIFVLGIEFTAYISMKQFTGSSGLYLTGLLGGGASSFATAGVMADIVNRKESLIDPAASAIHLATISMIVRNVGIATVLMFPYLESIGQLQTLYIVCAGIIVPLAGAAYVLQNRDTEEIDDTEFESPFSLKSGARFATLFLAVSFLSQLAQEFIGTSGLYITAFAGGIVSSTAVVTSAATSFTSGSITVQIMSGMVMLGIAGSILSKILLIEKTAPELRHKVTVPLLAISLFGIVLLTVI